MLKFSEMKTKTKILSGVLMSAMLLGAAAPTLANALSEPKVTYDDPWDVPGKTGVSVNNLLGVNDRDEKNFSKEEWEEIMRRVNAGTMEYYVFTEEALALEDFIKENFLPTHVISAASDSPIPSLTSSEKLKIFQYYVENNCSGILNIRGEKGETTTSCYNSDGDMIVSHDLGATWELASEDDWNYWMDSAHSAPKEGVTYPELSSSELDKVFLYYNENDCTGEIKTNVKVIETTGEELIVVSLYNKYGELLMSYDYGETWELASEDDWNYWMDAGEIEMLQEGNQGIEIVPIEVFPTVEIPEGEVEVIYGETVLGSLEDDMGFHDFEKYHPDTGELMTLTEWVLYQEEQLRVNRDIYAFLEEAYYVTSEEKPYFTEEHWAIILETAKTRENFYFETEQDYINYLLEAGLISY